MEWKDFFKITWRKAILLLILLFAGFYAAMAGIGCGLGMSQDFVCVKIVSVLMYSLGIAFALGTQIHFQIFRTDSGFHVWALIFHVAYSYLLSCVIAGFYSAIRNKKSIKNPLMALIILVLLVGGAVLVLSHVNKARSFDFLKSRGFVPSLDTPEKCVSKGFLWADMGEVPCVSCCSNNFTKEECISKGYNWDTCAYIDRKQNETTVYGGYYDVCAEKCVINI